MLKVNALAIKISPAFVANKVQQTNGNQEIEKIILVVEDSPYYIIEGRKEGKLLWLFPTEIETKTKINAESGEIISSETPLLGYFVMVG